MARGLTLRRYEVENVDYVWAGAFRLRVEAVDACGGMDARVFLWQRHPVDPNTGEERNELVTVCSPVDMSDFPAEEPDPSTTYPFFRRDWMELDYRAVSDAEEGWTAIRNAVSQLVSALDKLDILTLTIETRIGSTCEEDSASESATD